MARVIKFRCWNAAAKTMHEWDEMMELNKIHLLDVQNASYPVMQFTGLKDKNGKEIYEGDSLREHHDDGESNYAGVVSWIAEGDWLGWCIMDNIPSPELLRVENQNTYEVIGNIYESPEPA
jgi:uncharacterized phage protein (TIGR01671 family)